jgi:malate/lactate dehydrogenase
MIDVAIVGAGELGGSLAHVLARREIVRRIELVDHAGHVAAGKALDIAQSGPVERFTTPVVGSTDISRVAGATIVVIADAMPAAEVPDPLLLLKQISQLASRALVICADTNGGDLVERGVRELRYRRERLIGTAPEALASAVRALVALHVNGSVRDVHLAVLGLPPAQTVVNWEDATVAGRAVRRTLTEPVLRKLSAQVAALWPPGPHALAHAATESIATICGVSRRTLSCFVAPDDTVGRKTRTIALPVKLDGSGVVGIEEPALDAAAGVALENARQL